MANARNRASSASAGDRDFAATQWGVVLAAGHHSSPDSRQALERLCAAYWYPLYKYALRRITDVHQARDLTQDFLQFCSNAMRLKRPPASAGDFAPSC